MVKGKDGGAGCCVAFGSATCCCIVGIIVIGFVGLGIAKIDMGAAYLHNCSKQDLIPIWLIVSGFAPVLFCGFGRKNNEDSGESNNFCRTICGVLGFLFNLSWLICGSVWVYPNYGKITAYNFTPYVEYITTNSTQGDCNKSLITFAFAMVTIDCILMGLWINVICCIIARACKK